MADEKKPVIEFSVRVFLIAILLTVVLAVSNAYLALKLGILTSASIPAAILSMGILRFFKDSSILENNLVQTAASAGEAVAGGVVYTIPALVIIGYWQHFDYRTNFLIAVIGGVLGVLFSIPLRRVLVNDSQLKFPEGRAIAEVLKSSEAKLNINDLLYGGIIGAVFELFQVGFKLLASSWSYWFVAKKTLFGFGAGFSVTMIGAGYLVGQDIAISIFIGAVVSWFIAMPMTSYANQTLWGHYSATEAMNLLWNQEVRYLGIGAMLFAGIWTFLKLVRPLIRSIRDSLRTFKAKKRKQVDLPRTDQDLPVIFIVVGTLLMTGALFYLFHLSFPLKEVGFFGVQANGVVSISILYVLLFGFLFSVITAYFSGMVGVSASPGSSVVIAGILFAAWMLQSLFTHYFSALPNVTQSHGLEAMTVIIAALVTSIGAIANDNSQDLKVGQLVGATPWKQQVMLLVGVLISALIIPPVMELLYSVYGIAGVMPHAGMDLAKSLPAPTSALLAATTTAVFNNDLSWTMMFSGALVILAILALHWSLGGRRYLRLSPLGVAVGMYLPLASSFPLFIGGLIALFVNRNLDKQRLSANAKKDKEQVGTLIACGLVAGSALLDVLLTIPFSIWHSPDVLSLVGSNWEQFGAFLAVMSIAILARWINHRVMIKK